MTDGLVRTDLGQCVEACIAEQTTGGAADGADQPVARKLDVAEAETHEQLSDQVDTGAEWERLRALAASKAQAAESAAGTSLDQSARGEEAKRYSAPSTLIANWVQGVTSNIEKSIGRGSAAVRSSYPVRMGAGPTSEGAMPTSAKELVRHSSPAESVHFLTKDLAGGDGGGLGSDICGDVTSTGPAAAMEPAEAVVETAGQAEEARNWLGNAGQSSGAVGNGGSRAAAAPTTESQTSANRGGCPSRCFPRSPWSSPECVLAQAIAVGAAHSLAEGGPGSRASHHRNRLLRASLS